MNSVQLNPFVVSQETSAFTGLAALALNLFENT